MKKTIETIKIKNFKAFQEEQVFDIKGKNVLIYGTNGSGKSSLFWALYTFLQSSIKSDNEVKKYFETFDELNSLTHQSLKNVFMPDNSESYVDITFQDENMVRTSYKISDSIVNTNKNTDTSIQELNLASDFINYKLLHNFYNTSHKQEINLWPVFERDIFPFLTVGTQNWLEDIIKAVTRDVPRTPKGNVVSQNRKANYENELTALNGKIEVLLQEIQVNANKFLKEEFFENNEVIEVDLKFTKKFNFNKVRQELWKEDMAYKRREELQIKLSIKLKEGNTWKTIHRPHSFLNEAFLTRVAIAIRIGATQTRLESLFKILVLDDMLISLDMSNRMDVMRLILNVDNKAELKFFDNFQKIILTHDKGFFNLIQRHTNDNEWVYYKFIKDESKNEAPKINNDLTHLQKAEKYFEDAELDNCGNELRKVAEQVLTQYLDPNMKKLKSDFESLGTMLNKAITDINNNRFNKFKSNFISELELDKLKKIKENYLADGTLTDEEKIALTNTKTRIFDLLIELNSVSHKKETLLLNTKEILDRIMNAASHAGDNPLYTAELKDAIIKIKELKDHLNN